MADMKLTNQAIPNGVPNGLTEIQKMLTNITDDIAVSEAVTSYMTPDSRLVQAAETSGTFKVATILTSGLADYSKFKGAARGAVSTSWESYTCKYNRARSFMLDGIDVMHQDGLLDTTTVISTFMREQVVPEIDATRIATCASTAVTAGQTKSAAPAKASFLSDITTGINAVKHALKLRTTQGMKIHISDKYIDVLEQSTEFNRNKDIAGSVRTLDTGVTMINLAEVIDTPSDYMYTKFTYESGISSTEPTSATDVPAGGFSAASDATEVAALIVAPGVANGVVASEAQQIFPKGTIPGFFGSEVDYQIYHDCLILANKKKGMYAITVPKTERTGTAATRTSRK